ncbi:MAG: response regulator [Elusimicrobia bacterium]|nr:response regulator [Elusimicrobiota bacterium]
MFKVMVIDDDESTVCLLKHVMDIEKLEVLAAYNGLEALVLLTAADSGRTLPDVIILDITMPKMDGYAFHSRLQEIARLRNIPIIVCSAMEQRMDMFTPSSDIFAFVEKPFTVKNLVETVRAAIDSRLECGPYTRISPPIKNSARTPVNSSERK